MHALVIGGTGMLKKVSMWLCEKGFYVSIIGRDEVKLENVKRMSSAPENITCLSLDYHNDEDVKLAIKSTIEKNTNHISCCMGTHKCKACTIKYL